VAIPCEICGAPVARWQNMPGHYRRAHPDEAALLPAAIARYGLRRPRLSAGPPQPRALPQRAGHRAAPSPRLAGGRVRALAAEPRDPRVASPAEQSNIFPNRTPKGFWPPVVEPASGAAQLAAKPKPFNWVPWALAAGVALFLILGGSVEIEAASARSGAGASRWVSDFRPEGATQ